MTSRDDCIAEILASIKDRRNRKYVEDNLSDLDARAGMDDGPGSAREKYFRAAKEMLDEQMERAAVMKRNIRIDALTARDMRTFLDAAAKAEGGSYELGLQAALHGVNTPFVDPKSGRGNQMSVGALSNGAQKAWIGGVILDIRAKEASDPKFSGLEKLFYSKKIEDDIFIEKIELEKEAKGRAANVGRTKNEPALEIAKILRSWDKTKIDALNGAGAWITEHSAFGASVMHDPDKMRRAARPFSVKDPTGYLYAGFASSDRAVSEANRMAWVAATLPRIDAKRMFGTTVDADKKLAEMYGGLVNGDHLKMVSAAEEPSYFNVAAKVSAHREFVWKSAEDQIAYMREFGRFDPTDAWLNGMRDSANKYALMKWFGTKPKLGFEEAIAYARNMTTGKPEGYALGKWAPDQGGALRNRYAVVSGEADMPIANMWAGVVNGVMAVTRMSKLGLTPFAMLQDNVTISRELSRWGLDYFERNSGILGGYVQGMEGSAKREVADLLHTGILGRLRGVTARYDVADSKSGTMAWLENSFFKITGITSMTENKRADAERMMAYAAGRARHLEFAAIDPDLQRTLGAFGIGAKEWELLKKAEWNTLDGETYLTPDVATKLSDADIAAYLRENRPISEQAELMRGPGTPDIIAKAPGLADRTRQDLAMKLWAAYSERGQFAVLEVGPRERAILYQGTQSGSPLNTALRLLLQFKQFPTAMVTKAWGAEIYGGAKGMDRIAGMTELVVASTLFGMLANMLNPLAKGQDPTSQIKEHPVKWVINGFVRGGAASIYGDFLLGEWNRFGLPASATVLGPVLGQVDRVAELWADIIHPQWIGGDRKGGQTGALAARMVRENIPFANMIYTKWAVDYLAYYRLQEYLNPGYLERMERFQKDKQGVQFWLRPTQVQSRGFGPALSEAVGGRR